MYLIYSSLSFFLATVCGAVLPSINIQYLRIKYSCEKWGGGGEWLEKILCGTVYSGGDWGRQVYADRSLPCLLIFSHDDSRQQYNQRGGRVKLDYQPGPPCSMMQGKVYGWVPATPSPIQPSPTTNMCKTPIRVNHPAFGLCKYNAGKYIMHRVYLSNLLVVWITREKAWVYWRNNLVCHVCFQWWRFIVHIFWQHRVPEAACNWAAPARAGSIWTFHHSSNHTCGASLL